jgi:hypothetical protein
VIVTDEKTEKRDTDIITHTQETYTTHMNKDAAAAHRQGRTSTKDRERKGETKKRLLYAGNQTCKGVLSSRNSKCENEGTITRALLLTAGQPRTLPPTY